MSEEQRGVAQKIVGDEWSTFDHVDPWDRDVWMYQLGRAYGVERAKHEISAEARRMLWEMTHSHRDDPPIPSGGWAPEKVIRRMADRLGLDIEQEDE